MRPPKFFTLTQTPLRRFSRSEKRDSSLISTGSVSTGTKQNNVIGLCSELIKRFNGEVPEDFDALCSLPGVGHKTANVVLNVAFGHPTVAVDTHIFRVANRTGIAPGKTPDEVSEAIVASARRNISITRTTGSFFTAATAAPRETRNAGNARSGISANLTKRHLRRRKNRFLISFPKKKAGNRAPLPLPGRKVILTLFLHHSRPVAVSAFSQLR